MQIRFIRNTYNLFKFKYGSSFNFLFFFLIKLFKSLKKIAFGHEIMNEEINRILF